MNFTCRMVRMMLVASFVLGTSGKGLREAPAAEAQAATDRPPNLVVILVDDVGYSDVGVFGAEGFKTPNLDRMAAEGVKFTDFYVHPVCGVTRAAFMTGCYAMRVAEVANRKNGHPILHPDEITIAEVLHDAGYATGMVGKWHLCGPEQSQAAPELLPLGQGFDSYYGTPSHNGLTRTIEGSRFRAQLMRDNTLLDESIDQSEMDQLVGNYTREAVSWIEAHRDEPFFLYLAHNMAHVVLGASERFRGSSDRGLYGDAMQELDWSVGQVLQTLDRLDLDENTLVVFLSDNGPWVEAQLAGETPRDDHYGRNVPLRGAKMMTWEGGVRVPMIARWPGHVPSGEVCHEPAMVIDFLPTFAQLAGTSPPDDRTIDGRDIAALLTHPTEAKTPHDVIYYYSYVHLQAVRSGPWKLVRPRPARPPWCLWSARMTDEVTDWELYNLADDLSEARNVAAEHADTVARLKGLFEQGRAEIGDYDRVGAGQRFFDDGPRREESQQWITAASGS